MTFFGYPQLPLGAEPVGRLHSELLGLCVAPS
jgi:hypothetical protein